jgi:DNA repair exonuclease SbcCD ATPase subunit
LETIIVVEDIEDKIKEKIGADVIEHNNRYETLKGIFNKIQLLKQEEIQYKGTIIRLNKEIDRYNDKLDKISNHKYDPKCDACMSNSITKDLLYINNEIKNLQSDYDTVKEILNKLRTKIESMTESDIQEEIKRIEYDKNIVDELKMKIASKKGDNKLATKDCQILEIHIKQKTDNRNIMVSKIAHNNNIDKKIELLDEQLNYHNTVIDNIRIYEGIVMKLYNIEGELNMVSVDMDMLKYHSLVDVVVNPKELYDKAKDILGKLNCKKKDIEHKIYKFRHDQIRLEEIKKDYEEAELERNTYVCIKKLLDKDGLVDKILTDNIIPYLEESINGILDKVGHYRISIKYHNQSVNIYMNGKLNVIMSSGYESYLLDLVFRLALVQINNHVKTKFLIIDEGFNACDQENKNNVRDLLSYMKSHYDWILIVSHDEFIKSFYDMSISIEHKAGFSKLINN